MPPTNSVSEGVPVIRIIAALIASLPEPPRHRRTPRHAGPWRLRLSLGYQPTHAA